MSPDEKYMLPNFNNTTEDIKFQPLLDELGLKNMTLGWIPVFFPSSPIPTPFIPSTIPTQFNGTPPLHETVPSNGMTNTAELQPRYQEHMNSIPNNSLNNVDKTNSTMMQALRDFDLDLNEETDLSRVPPNRVDRILSDIENNNPGAFSLLDAYRIPRPIIRLIVQRIIRLTLNYCKDDR